MKRIFTFILISGLFASCDSGTKKSKMSYERPNEQTRAVLYPVNDSQRMLFEFKRYVMVSSVDSLTGIAKTDTIWGAPMKDSTGKFLGYQPVPDSLVIWNLDGKDLEPLKKIK